MEEQLLLLKPLSLESKSTNSRKISPITNNINFWTSLRGYSSKHEWMSQIFEYIDNQIGTEKLTFEVVRYIELCLENFADNCLSQIIISDIEPSQFGIQMLQIWLDVSIEEIEDNTQLFKISEMLQQCYEDEKINLIEDDSDVTNLFINITEKLIYEFLSSSLEYMLTMISEPQELTLYFVIYTAKYNPCFNFFSLDEYNERDVIPEKLSEDGITVGILRLSLNSFIKTNYDIRPSYEDGTIELLVGVSNIIVINEKSDELVADKIDEFIEIAETDNQTIYLNLHRYILYLIFEQIQIITKKTNSMIWTNGLILDAINTVSKKFLKEIL
jgi:hypothetical protein